MSGPGPGGCLQFFGGRVSPILGGVSNFSGGCGLQIFGGGGLQFFWGRSPNFGIRSTFGRYASYWNAFLLDMN